MASGAGEANLRVFEQFKNKHQSHLDTSRSPGELNKEYYDEYCKIFVANSILLDKVKEVVEQKEELITKIKKLQVNRSHIELGNTDSDQPFQQEHAQKEESS